MRFLISNPCYLQGVLHRCEKGQKVILEVPDTEEIPDPENPEGKKITVPFRHISVTWRPMDAASAEAQRKAFMPKKNPLTGAIEKHLLGTREIDEKWKGHPVVKNAGFNIVGKGKSEQKLPVPTIDHATSEAPLDATVAIGKDGEAPNPAGA